jgi:hypothetical protein
MRGISLEMQERAVQARQPVRIGHGLILAGGELAGAF